MKTFGSLLILLGTFVAFSMVVANDLAGTILLVVHSPDRILSYDLGTDAIDEVHYGLNQPNRSNNLDAVDRSYEGEYVSFVEIDDTESRLVIQNMEASTLESFEGFRAATWSPTMNVFATFDLAGDIVIYDIEEQIITHSWNFMGEQGDLTWSPDSRFLAFYSAVDIETGQESGRLFEKFIYIMEIQSGIITLVADESDACGPYSEYRYLEWSPDGERLAFSAQCAASRNAPIFAIELNGFLTGENWTPDAIELRQLTVADTTRHGSAGLAWSPDGKTLVFTNAPLGDGVTLEPYLYAIDISDVESEGAQVPGIFLDFSDFGTYVSGPVWY